MKTRYKKKNKNGIEYYFFRLHHKNLRRPRDLYGRTVHELQDKIDTLRDELDHGVQSDKCAFGDYLAKWMTSVLLVDKKQSTINAYNSLYHKHIKNSRLSKTRMNNLTAFDVQDFYQDKIKAGLSSSILHKLSLLIHPCIRYAYAQGKIMTDFTPSISLPKTSKKKMEGTHRSSRALSVHDETALLEACKGTQWETIITFALNTGFRRGEMLALTWDDIDFDGKTATVNKSYRPQSGTTSPKTPSSNRSVPLPDSLLVSLRRLKASQSEIKLRMANKYSKDNLVFANAKGCHLSTSSLNRSLKNFAETIGLDSINMHDFRDTYATRLYEKTRDLKMIQTLLGHADLSTTADIYTHISMDEKQKYIQNNL